MACGLWLHEKFSQQQPHEGKLHNILYTGLLPCHPLQTTISYFITATSVAPVANCCSNNRLTCIIKRENVAIEDQAAVLRISCKLTEFPLAAVVDTGLVLCGLNCIVFMPAASSAILTHLLRVPLLMLL